MLYELGPRARRVYHALIDQIRSGELAPGTRLPAHTQLAASFGVAPLTMRQVLARLEADRLVVRERGRGTFVRAAESPYVLVVAARTAQRADLEQQVRGAGKRPVVAATPAEALATLEREAVASLAIIELRLPTASAGLRLVRRVRQRLPELPLAVLNPTGRQRSRLERTVAPPLLFVGDSPLDQLSQVLRADLAQTESSPPTAETMLHRLELLLERYVPLQLAGERAAARSLMLQEGLAAGLSVADLYRSVLEPAQYRVGDLWGADQISVAREHLASSVTEAVMVDLAASAAREPDTGMRVVVACVQGELHDIGARMVADLLELDGFTVRFLGADVPTDSLVTIVAEELATVLVVSAAMAERLVELRVAVARLRQAYGRGLRIFVGGQVMQWAADAVRALEVDLAAGDALETLTAARRLLTHEPA
ncbi:MAG: GntR family transcriptional regulator [Chloroflexi bacterium]|nr:GntR family transcriptional regulator [Chloroflexota bacterium]